MSTPPHQIKQREEFEQVLTSGSCLLFKHSLRCSTSSFAFREFRRFVAAHPEVRHAWLDVVAQRSWAREVAATTGVRHQSPQALWLADGHVLWHASHFDITEQSLNENVC